MSETATPPKAKRRDPPTLLRSRDDRVIAGVCGGIGVRYGIEPVFLRIAFAVLAAVTGSGIFLYAAAWLLIPKAPADGSGSLVARPGIFRTTLGIGLIVIAGLLFVGSVFRRGFIIPIAIAAVGIAVIWDWIGGRTASRDDSESPRRSRWRFIGRITVGTIFLAGGVIWILAASESIKSATARLIPVLVPLGGLAILLGPVLWRLWTNLSDERTKRIRNEEREAVAAHLHDSVLQTLALIQRHPDDPARVSALARQQERELRDWLYGTSSNESEESLKTALEELGSQIEAQYRVRVEVVSVGSAYLDEDLDALVKSTREAVVNAAKFAGVDTVSVYSEAFSDACHIFIRDRGAGFDPEGVDPDRHGIRDSIVGRVEHRGGTALIRSALGEGTEVELHMNLNR